MGEKIEVDFLKRRRHDDEAEPLSAVDLTEVHKMRLLKTRNEASPDELIDQAAQVAAAHNLAVERGDELEIEDIGLTLHQALSELTTNEVEEVYKKAQELIDQWTAR